MHSRQGGSAVKPADRTGFDGGETRRNGTTGFGGAGGQNAEEFGFPRLGMMGFRVLDRLRLDRRAWHGLGLLPFDLARIAHFLVPAIVLLDIVDRHAPVDP
jgi:hypothetical protein